MEVNEQELIEYIFEQLVARGIVVNREDIAAILDLEMEYMVKEGMAVPIEEGA
ncbi:hypothetical protein D3C76_187370 [compost metagenome]